MLESKDPNAFNTIEVGETLLLELDQHKDVNAQQTQNHINQLGISFNMQLIKQLSTVASCNRIDGIPIDDNELASLADVIKEAARPKMEAHMVSSVDTTMPMTRQSLNILAGDENDLLAELPAISKVHKPPRVSDQGGYPKQQAVDEEFEQIDEQLINEIEDYLKGVMENNEKLIEMSDSPIGSSGAKCVAAAVTFCEHLTEMKLNNCMIKDSGAKALFDEMTQSRSLITVNLSNNPITEKSFDSLAALLTKNTTIKTVSLFNISVKSKMAWSKLSKFGDRVKH
jgi:hypothetical protein